MRADTCERLGPFRLLEELGRGAMGTVYLAEDTDEDRTVALKVLHPHLLTRKGFFQRFQREALAGQQVRHPNVVQTLDCSFHVTEEIPYCVLVMEYVRGRTLRELLHDLGTVPESLVREIGRQVAEGLTAIHDAGLVHRDLKPENVLITDDHRVRIMDLGVARHTQQSTALTQDGQFAGSLLYAAPEQFRVGASVEPPADLYALGVVLYELISGVNPFRHDEPGAVMNAHLDHAPERLDRRMEGVSHYLTEVVAALLAKEVDARLGEASELATVLEEGEGSGWWQVRERALLEEREHRIRVPVRRETKVYGREDDVALLEAAWAKAKAGEGNTVLLEGEAGIGKSRLVDVFLANQDSHESDVLYGSYAPSGGRGGISDALLDHFGEAELEAALRPHLTVTPSLVPSLAAVLRGEVPPEGAPPLQGDPLHATLVHLMRSLAEARPLIWVVEDLHFADPDGRKLALLLARAVAGHRVLLCLTTRPELSAEELSPFASLENLKRTGLARLGARDVVLLLEDAFQSAALAEKLGVRIAKKSDGVPFFVFEMIRGLKEGQFITRLPDGSWVESKVIDDIEIPSAVRDLVAIRLGDLAKEERAILDVGAVQGFEFDPDLVARVLERPRVAVLQDVAEIERRSGVLRSQGRCVCFDHHQIQEVVYTNLSGPLREELHSLFAEALAAREGLDTLPRDEVAGGVSVLLATHLLQGRRPLDAQRHLQPALSHLQASHRHEALVRLTGTALAHEGLLTGEDRLGWLFSHAASLDLLGRREDQRRALDEAARLTDLLAGDRAKVCIQRGNYFHACGRTEEALEEFRSALALSDASGDRQTELRARSNIGGVSQALSLHTEAETQYQAALGLARSLGERQLEAGVLGNLGHLCLRVGRTEVGLRHLEHSLAVFVDLGDRLGESRACSLLASAFANLSQLDLARTHAERCLRINRGIGNRVGEGRIATTLGNVYMALGAHDKAREYHERSCAIAREVGDGWMAAVSTMNLGLAHMLLGRFQQAGVSAEQAISLHGQVGNKRGVERATGNLGLVAEALGHYREAQTCFARRLELARESEDPWGEANATRSLGRVAVVLGRPDEALHHAEEHLEMIRRLGDRTGEQNAMKSLGQVSAALCHYDEAQDWLERALVMARQSNDKSGTAEVLLDLGLLRAELGLDHDACRHLEEARRLASEYRVSSTGVLAACALAALTDCETASACADLEAQEDRMGHWGRMQGRFHLWQATREPQHLQEARRLLDHLVECAPEEYRESMLKHVRLHQEIVEAWEEHGEKAELEAGGGSETRSP